MATYDAHVGDAGTTITKTLRVGGTALGTLVGATFIVRVTNPSGAVESWDTNAPSSGAPGWWGMAGGVVQFVTPSTSPWDEVGVWTWDVQYTLGGVTQTADPLTLSVGPSGASASVAATTARRFVIIGDSTAADPFVSDLAIVPWVRRFATRLRGADPYSFVYSRGVPSRAFTDWTTALMYAAVREYDATDAIVVLGINDLLNAGTMTYAALLARANVVYDDLADMGVRVHAGNITPCGLSGDEEGVRELFNAWLLAGNATSPTTTIDLATAVADPADTTQLLAANDYGDGVHLSDAGYVIIGDTIADALELP